MNAELHFRKLRGLTYCIRLIDNGSCVADDTWDFADLKLKYMFFNFSELRVTIGVVVSILTAVIFMPVFLALKLLQFASRALIRAFV